MASVYTSKNLLTLIQPAKVKKECHLQGLNCVAKESSILKIFPLHPLHKPNDPSVAVVKSLQVCVV